MMLCDAILAARVADRALSPAERAHLASCARCAATARALALTRPSAAAPPPPPVPPPAVLQTRARRRAARRLGAVAAIAAILLFLTRALVPADPTPALARAAQLSEPDLFGLLDDVAELDLHEDVDDPPGTEVLGLIDPLVDPWADDPFTALMAPSSHTPKRSNP